MLLENWSYEVDWNSRTYEVSRDVKDKNFLLIWWVISLVSNPKYSDRRVISVIHMTIIHSLMECIK